MYQYTDPQDEQTKTQVSVQKPPMRKHTPNPTVVYSLPNSKLISVELSSQVEQKVTLIINHQQLIMLPFDQQFPFQLHRDQSISLLTDVNNVGYLELEIRKCDQSVPQFGYTFDYDSFQKGQFEYTATLQNQPRFKYYIKASKIGTLYMQINSTDDLGLFSITIRYGQQKIRGDRVKAGGNGVLEYKFIDSTTAQVSFHPVVCSYSNSNSKCEQKVKYYWMAGDNLQDVYTQTVCPYSYFQILSITSSQPLKVNQIHNNNSNNNDNNSNNNDNNNIITFTYPYSQHISYLSVKAVSNGDSGQQIYYQPIQVMTMWGTLTKSTHTHTTLTTMLKAVLGVVLVIVALRCYRKYKSNRGYDQLNEREGEGAFDY